MTGTTGRARPGSSLARSVGRAAVNPQRVVDGHNVPSGTIGRLSKRRFPALLEPVEADQRACPQHKREPPLRTPIPPNRQAPIARQPRQRPLHPPAMPPQPGRRLNPTPSDPHGDPTTPQAGTVAGAVVALVRIQLAGPVAPPARRRAHRRDVVDHRLQHGHVRDVDSGHRCGKRQPVPLTDELDLGPWLAAIDRICANVVPPRLARTLAESTLARDQSSRPCSPSRSRMPRWICSNTPALAHSARRRQAVAGEPQPSSLAGSSRHGWRCAPCR